MLQHLFIRKNVLSLQTNIILPRTMESKQIEVIKDAIRANGMSIPKLAEASGVSLPTLRRMLNPKENDNTTITTISKIASALGIEPESIVEARGFSGMSFLGVKGYIDYRGKITRIESFKDLEKITEGIKRELEAPEQVKSLYKQSKANQMTQSLEPVDIALIDLFREETYDTSLVSTWSFRKSDDERDGDSNDLGNMCKGYPFKVCGELFLNSKCAYIAGLFSQDTSKAIEIQKELQACDNGYEAKKAIRRKYEQVGLARADWNEFNVQWMLFVVWQKVIQNRDFAKKLRKIPSNAVIVENSSYQKGETRLFWGMENREVRYAHETIEIACEVENFKGKKMDIRENVRKNQEKLNNIGTWKGVNCMGKILTICKHCLEDSIEPPIDYGLLHSKRVYLFGKLLTFENLK